MAGIWRKGVVGDGRVITESDVCTQENTILLYFMGLHVIFFGL